MTTDTIARLERLRQLRGRRERDTSIMPLVRAVARDLTRQDRAAGGADEAWRRVMPPALVKASRVVSQSRGTLVVAADSSATAYELDRVLRAGLEGELRAALRCGSLRIRVRVGA